MYDSYYNLSEKPFQINTDPRFLWLGEKHQEALANLKYGLVDRNGLVVLTGDIGTGKTTVVNALLDALDDAVCVAKINHPSLEPDQFLSLMAKTFDPDFVVAGKSDLLLFFNHFLKKEHAHGRTVLLVVDEAHRLNAAVMEEIRLLTNMEQAGKSLLSVIFVGQQELLPILQSPQCRALRQRITLYYNIDALTGEETALYMQHRLDVSSARAPLFSPAAITRIYTYTKGYPRMINILCDRALVTGYVRGAHLIDEAIITECAREIDLLPERATPLFWTKVNQMLRHGGSLLRRAAKAGDSLKPRAKTAVEFISGVLSRWHSKGGQFSKRVLSRTGRLMVRPRRGIEMGLAASAVTLLLSTWSIQAFSVAEGPEPTIASKRPKTAAAEPAPPPFFPPVRATPQERADTATAENKYDEDVEPVAVNGHYGPLVRDNSAWSSDRALMRDVGRMVAPSPADAAQQQLEAKLSTFSHQVKWPQETLYSIALWYCGSGEHWREIVAANPSLAPDHIRIGNTIAIPLSLLKTREPMPIGFLENRKKFRPTPAIAPHTTSIEPPPLFGLIDPPQRSTSLDGGRLPETLETLN